MIVFYCIQIIFQLRELKKKLMDSMDKTKSSEKRAKELEDILNVSTFLLQILKQV